MALSPMMKQYLEIKENYKDCVVFFRLGDFYEMFFEDAIRVSKILDLVLTGRDCGLEERAPMCGVPYHAADSYIAKLVEKGERVAICEQLTDPADSKGIVERGVIKVVSAGTMTDDAQLDEQKNNYLISIYSDNKNTAYAFCDITTGDFVCGTILNNSINSAVDFILTLSPAEIICNSIFFDGIKNTSAVISGALPKPQIFSDWAYNFSAAEKALKSQFKVLSLDAYDIASEKHCISAAGALVEYLKQTQMHTLPNINKISKHIHGENMVLDYNAVRNLELIKSMRDGGKYGTLIWIMDKTVTGMGARMLYNWLLNPLYDIDKINYRLDGVENLYKNPLIFQAIRELLKTVKDIERLSGKLSNNNFSPRDCIGLKNSIAVIPSLKMQLTCLNAEIIKRADSNLLDMSDLVSLIESAISQDCPPNIKDGGYIKDDYNNELDELRKISKSGKDIIAKIELRERRETGIKNLKIGFNRVFGYYIEVTNSFKEHVPYSYTRKQTLSNAERFVTDELKNAEEQILGAQERALRLEEELFLNLKETLSQRIVDLQRAAKALSLIDCLCSLAVLAKENNYTRPKISGSDSNLDIVEGRHPVVERVSKEKFVPNDSFINNSSDRIIILTGPNMAGKSTYMRQIALITIMAHIGSFIPASCAQIPLTDRIFTRIGASDNLVSDQSTFMVEMTETAVILNNATENSLIILDEIGRGTSTFDGLSIAWAVVEYLSGQLYSRTLFATHYHELTELEGLIDGVKNYKITVKEFGGSIIFLRKIVRGGANKSFGIEVAELAGIPKEVTINAKKVLNKLEKSDITSNYKAQFETEKEVSEIEKALLKINLDNLSPIAALNVLDELINLAKSS